MIRLNQTRRYDSDNYNKSTLIGLDNMLFIENLEHTLSKLPKDAFLCLNVCVNQLGYNTLPVGHSLYVLGCWAEIFDEDWFLQVYNKHKTAEFLVLGNFYPGNLTSMDRVKFIRFLDFKWFKNQITFVPINWSNKKYKLSSLSYFVNEYRFFITSCLLNKKDVLFSWHNQHRDKSNIDYIYTPTGNKNRDKLLRNRKSLNRAYTIDNFNNSHTVSNLVNSNLHPAYSNSVVNSINETKDVSWHPNFGDCPTPYLTEKTWKAIYNGNAILFSAQYNTKKLLEELGFVFNYPWSNNYADVPGDLDRLEQILDTVNTITEMSLNDIISGVKHSCEFNQHHFFSTEFDNIIDNINQTSLVELEKYCGEKY